MGKRAVVTGANRGVGAEFARQLRALGWQVIEGNRSAGLDLADPVAIEGFANSLGDAQIDLLINNAAIGGDAGGLATLEAEGFLEVIRVNTLGPLLLVKALLPLLKGVVVNISSRSGSMAEGRSDVGDYAYKCSKAALNMAGVKLADESGLTVLALHPGWAQTDMGGPQADVPVQESVAGMLKIILEAGESDSRTFRAYDGAVVAW